MHSINSRLNDRSDYIFTATVPLHTINRGQNSWDVQIKSAPHIATGIDFYQFGKILMKN